MSVAIIVLNYNDYENTKKYVELIEKYDSVDKIVIVDNNSNENGQLEKLQLLVSDKVDLIVSDKNGGYAYGNNYGLRYIDEKYGDKYNCIIISNPDVYVEESAIEYMQDYILKHDNVAVVAPRMYFSSGVARRSSWKNRSILIDIANSTRLTEFIFYPIFKSGEYKEIEYEKEALKVDVIAGSFFMANHKKFKEIGYFDENTFLFFEEDILSKRLNKVGYEIYSLNNIKFIHYESQTIGKAMNVFKKVNILFDSKIYYHKCYNNANEFEVFVFCILKYIRKFELLFEIPIRKLFKK